MNNSNVAKLIYIKKLGMWSIFGWFLFVFPGLISTILLIIELCKYEDENQINSNLRIAAIVLIILDQTFGILGYILAISWTNKNIKNLKKLN